ncbi:hypothetical protein K4G60_g3311 [Candida parapsilosis]|nr:hypothetical protein K4G60_g3311 [Candida parapsilosis]KAI5908786.1 hypothetical protein K4G61_g2473 [Candida parapsilosis]
MVKSIFLRDHIDESIATTKYNLSDNDTNDIPFSITKFIKPESLCDKYDKHPVFCMMWAKPMRDAIASDLVMIKTRRYYVKGDNLDFNGYAANSTASEMIVKIVYHSDSTIGAKCLEDDKT